MAYEFISKRKLAFHETDMAGIAHFSNFFRWMEETEHEFLLSLQLSPIKKHGPVFHGWPRIHADCDYHSPLRVGDVYECHLCVKSVKAKSVEYLFKFQKLDVTGEAILVAKGSLTCVHASIEIAGNSIEALLPTKTILAEKMSAAPEEVQRNFLKGN